MSEKPAINLSYYCTLYVDVLGQSERLKGLKELPGNEREMADTIEILRQTVGFLESLRGWFKAFFDEHANLAHTERLSEHDKSRAVARVLDADIISSFFSDSIQVSVCLQDGDEAQAKQVNAVATAMLAACAMHLFALSVGMPTRGGIDVGLGVRMNSGEVYGSALVSAVQLEEKVAGYPRIVVGDGLLEYLASVAAQPMESPLGQLARMGANWAKQLVFRDSDGRFALDFMGAEVNKRTRGIIGPDLIGNMISFIKQQRARFISEGNVVLTGRYELLWAYLVSRAPLWGVDLTNT